MTDNKKIAEQVLAAVGGAANLKDATHCMTRLRLYLKDDSLPKDDEVKKISGVLGVVRGGQQYQIVIGTNVPKVYEELCKLAGISASAAVKDDAAAVQDAAITKRKLTPKQVGKNIITARQIKKLGLGCAFLDKKAITSEGLKAAIVKLLTEPSYKETAHAFSEDMRSLGGAKASAEALLAYLKQ